jgi:hypothetical protein
MPEMAKEDSGSVRLPSLSLPPWGSSYPAHGPAGCSRFHAWIAMRDGRTSAVNLVRSSPPQFGNAAGQNLPGGHAGLQ